MALVGILTRTEQAIALIEPDCSSVNDLGNITYIITLVQLIDEDFMHFYM